jgi:hypothetical protein
MEDQLVRKIRALKLDLQARKIISVSIALVYQVMLDNKELLKGLNHGKGVIRYSNPDKIDFVLIRKMLIDTFNSDKKPC